MFNRRRNRVRAARASGRDSRRASFAEALERRIVLAGGPLDPSVHLETIAPSLPSYLNDAQAKLRLILDHPLPVVGKQLDSAIHFYDDFRARVVSAFSATHNTVAQ